MEDLLNELKEERLDRDIKVISHSCRPGPLYFIAHGKLKPEEALKKNLIDKEDFDMLKKEGSYINDDQLGIYGFTELSIKDLKDAHISTEFSGESRKLYSDEEFKLFEDIVKKSIIKTTKTILQFKSNLDENSSLRDLGLGEYEIRNAVKDLDNITEFDQTSLLQEIFIGDLHLIAIESKCNKLWEDVTYADLWFSKELLEELWLLEELLPEKYDSFKIIEIESVDQGDVYRGYSLQAGKNKELYDSIDTFETLEAALSYVEYMYNAEPDSIEYFPINDYGYDYIDEYDLEEDF